MSNLKYYQFQISNKQIRNCIEYRNYRTLGFKRDNYTCQLCGQRGERLQLDHFPTPFSIIIVKNNIKTLNEALNCKELWDLSNGRTLCLDCHKETVTYLNRNIIKQYQNGKGIK